MNKYSVLIGLLYCAMLPAAFADGYSAGTTPQGSEQITYSSQPTTPQTPAPSRQHHKHHDEKTTISINVSDAAQQFVRHGNFGPVVIEKKRHHPRRDLEWVTFDRGDLFPKHMVTGGYQRNPPATLYVCRVPYRGGVHPGKVFQGNCNFSWGGNEVVTSTGYEVLTSRHPLHWAAGSYGSVPPFAIEGGYQHDGPLYICQARYRGGMHPGKLYKEACLIGWGGQEVGVPEYYVLTK